MIPAYLQLSHFAGRRIHMGVTGSIAAYKALDLCRELLRADLLVSATLTDAAREFVTPLSFRSLGAHPVYCRLFPEAQEPFGHLEPGQQADVMLIAPATANTLAKMSCGLADDILSCQYLAFPRKVVAAPAMNPRLWNAPATLANAETLANRNVAIVGPDSGDMACGEQGKGRLAPLQDIYFATLRALSPSDLSGKSVLITLGPTREYWDPVRYWSNPSSGKMGAALALAAWLRGAEVHCVAGPSDVWLPPGVSRYAVTSAHEMFQRCVELWPGMDVACLSAAVCDFKPQSCSREKFKKDSLCDGRLEIAFAKNPDILLELGRSKGPQQQLIGFAAETDAHIAEAAEAKLRKKNLDLIVANRIGEAEAGFDSSTNAVLLLDRHNRHQEYAIQSKADIAWRIWDWILLS